MDGGGALAARHRHCERSDAIQRIVPSAAAEEYRTDPWRSRRNLFASFRNDSVGHSDHDQPNHAANVISSEAEDQ
jgi:hypothetical protein